MSNIQLLIAQLRHELDIPLDVIIHITSVSDENAYTDEGHYNGLCIYHGGNLFELRFNEKVKEGSYLMYEVVSHEMKHVEQYLNGDLITKARAYYWKNKRGYYSKVKYRDRPYEREAFQFGRWWAYKNHPFYQGRPALPLYMFLDR